MTDPIGEIIRRAAPKYEYVLCDTPELARQYEVPLGSLAAVRLPAEFVPIAFDD